MTNTEGHQPAGGTDQQPQGEGGQPSYFQTVRFPTEQHARTAYTQARTAIFETSCDLSVYRFLLDETSHVAVLGTSPASTVEARLRTILAAGEAVALPTDVQQILIRRRREAAEQGSWVERHYRPGHVIRRPRR